MNNLNNKRHIIRDLYNFYNCVRLSHRMQMYYFGCNIIVQVLIVDKPLVIQFSLSFEGVRLGSKLCMVCDD